jgi:hypothetical protein
MEMNMIDLADEAAIRRLIARFATSFDLKAWEDLAACLAPRLHTDYSDLRGTAPETLTRERFVELRRSALQDLRTQHLAGNVEIAGDGGSARVSMAIFRRRPDGVALNTHCVYQLGLARGAGGWQIDAIAQKVLWSDGDPSIHAGTAGQRADAATT